MSAEDKDLLKRLERGSVSEEAAPERVRELKVANRKEVTRFFLLLTHFFPEKVAVLTILVGVVSNMADGVLDLLAAADLKLLLDG